MRITAASYGRDPDALAWQPNRSAGIAIHAARLTHLDPSQDGAAVAVLDDGERRPVDAGGYERRQERF